MSLPKTVKAVIQPDPASSDLELTTLPFPEMENDDDHLVKVEGTSPCLGELTWEAAFPSLFEGKKRDRVPGTEGSGVIIKAPAGSEFKDGDQVFWRTDAWITGAAREYTIVPGKFLARKPGSLSLIQAAATPLSSLTAWQGLFEHGNLDPEAIEGDKTAREKNAALRVLITGASGSVGSYAVRFASAAGVGTIVAVCSGAKAAEVRKYGATDVIDYRATTVEAWAGEDAGRKVDLILDCVGGNGLAGLWSALKDGGTFLSVSGNPADSKPAGKTVKAAKWYLVNPRGSDLARIARLIERGGFTPLIDSVVPLDQFAQAWKKVDSGKAQGKVVVTLGA